MSSEPEKRPRPNGPFPTGTTRQRGLIVLPPMGPNAANPAWQNASVQRTAHEVLGSPPAGASIDWLWAELPPLREWVVRTAAALEMPVDADRLVLRVIESVVAQRPELAEVPPREYLHALVEKLVVTSAA